MHSASLPSITAATSSGHPTRFTRIQHQPNILQAAAKSKSRLRTPYSASFIRWAYPLRPGSANDRSKICAGNLPRGARLLGKGVTLRHHLHQRSNKEVCAKLLAVRHARRPRHRHRHRSRTPCTPAQSPQSRSRRPPETAAGYPPPPHPDAPAPAPKHTGSHARRAPPPASPHMPAKSL